MPDSHRQYAEWTPGRLVRWAEETGQATAGVVQSILRSYHHPQQGFRSCLGILRLSRSYGPERLEAACARALAIQTLSYRSINSILKNGLDRQPLPAPQTDGPHRNHPNVRGSTYYR